MVWAQTDVTKTHVAYAVVAVFTLLFSVLSLFIRERLFIGEASLATIYGLVVGPHCLNWFVPSEWGNPFYNTIELARILLCVDIVHSSVELPPRYLKNHGISVVSIMFPTMIFGWLIISLFIWAIIPGATFVAGLVISACITATDPVLAQAVVGHGPFAKRIPSHVRNLLISESACNDGMSVPFIYLALNIMKYGSSNTKELVKNWICISVLYMCVFGLLFGAIIGTLARYIAQFCAKSKTIDRPSMLAFYITISLFCAGFGSMLGFDDLLASFAAGCAFCWDGWVSEQYEDSDASGVIDLLLNIGFFVYFGAFIPWETFNDGSIGLDAWRLVLVAIVVLTLRRIPTSVLAKYYCPDIHSWKDGLTAGHFGPIGVSAIFGCIIAITEIESDITNKNHHLLTEYPNVAEHYQLLRILWPVVSFVVLSSMIVHGLSVPVIIYAEKLKLHFFKGEDETDEYISPSFDVVTDKTIM